MDKVLAFSILSASPADIAAGKGGLSGRWARLSWRNGAGDHAERQQQQQQRDKEKQSSPRRHGGGDGPAKPPRFAPEFDGIDCFETIVSH